MKSLLALILLAVIVVSGCVGLEETGPDPTLTEPDPASGTEWVNVTDRQTVPRNTAACSAVAVCVVYGYAHKIADLDNMTLIGTSVEVSWDAPPALCGNLRASINISGSESNDGALYVQSGGSPLRFDLTNLTIPLRSSQGGFLRLSISPEYFEGPLGRLYANLPIEYDLKMSSLVRPTVATDAPPRLAWDAPHMQGPIDHCEL